jgi:hypothetical protein
VTELQDDTLIEISEQDLAAILTEAFCGNYTPFKRQRVHSVDQNEGTDMFTIRLSPNEPEEAA